METNLALAIAIIFVWMGMVLAISFLETPLKFKAPGITTPLGLGIGRVVFKALNIVEAILSAALITIIVIADISAGKTLIVVIPVVILLIQLAAIRPPMSKRTDRKIAGEELPKSSLHLALISLEVAKVAALALAGVVLFGLL